MINIEILVKDRLNKLWNDFSTEEFCQAPPLSVAEAPKNGLLFIGINPSLSEKDRIELEEKKDLSYKSYKLKYEEDKEYRYFKKFYDVAKKTEMNWGHIDILYQRETSQKKVESLLKTEHGVDFIYRQCMITKTVLDNLIDENNPRIFVVTNTFARNLLGLYRKENEPKRSEHWIGYDFVWNEDIGTYMYKNNPFFLSGMLTGQRALDNGSYERLIWQINFVKNKINLPQSLQS
ncbi:MAG: hypothetical protein COA58_09140 [Bacteroidetes bacterium]|nr:MAG: hypothetical protein COA58_09140 [Bacteroidota bacterium]